MTPEEIEAMQKELETQRQAAEALKLERDSLREENDKLLQENAAQKKELEDTKKLNFTLARQTSRQDKTPEELLNEMFK